MAAVNDVADLSRLSVLDEGVILDQLRARFKKEKYYTFIGDVLIALNPNKPLTIYTDEYHRQFSDAGTDAGKLPHIFWIAQQAYINLQTNQQAQCILVSGESGSGKTESTKLIIKHVSYLCPSAESSLHEQIVRINPLLEALGNAVTPMNDNSSRFGKLVELFFTDNGHMSGGRIHDYLLEKSRVVTQGPGERNFHFFYYMFAGLPKDKLLYYYLEDAQTYKILDGERNGRSPWEAEDIEKYKSKFDELMDIIHLVGFTEEDVSAIFTLLSSILHVTNLVFDDDGDTDGVYIVDEFPLRIAAGLLGVDVEDLTEALISNTVYVRGEKVQSLKKRHQANDGRDALAKALYSRLFGWIVGQINVHLQPVHESDSIATISVLDMSGFECLTKNSFEQLCINTANERLHKYFNNQIFSLERSDYQQEDIPLDLVEFKDNQLLIDLFFQKPTGIFSIIDEESTFPRATDKSLVQKLNNVCASNPGYVPSPGNATSFTISHYAGDVTYDARGMLEKNRDSLGSNINECMSTSSSDMVALFFRSSPAQTGSFSKSFGCTRIRPHLQTLRADLDRSDSSVSRATGEKLRNKSLALSKSGTEVHVKSFVSRYFRKSLNDLMQKMAKANPWFVRCVRPNSAKRPERFSNELVMNQLRYNGVLQIAKIRRNGFAIRLPFADFVTRFKEIAFPAEQSVDHSPDTVRTILDKADLSDYVFGKTKIFLRHWQGPALVTRLENTRREIAEEKERLRREDERRERERLELERREELMREKKQRELMLNIQKEHPKLQHVRDFDDSKKRVTMADDISSEGSSAAHKVREWMKMNDKVVSNAGEGIQRDVSGFSASFLEKNESTILDPQNVSVPVQEIPDASTLDQSLWDRFQMIPRDSMDTSKGVRTFLKFFKCIFYLLLFVLVLGSAVVNKLSVIIMTSGIVRDLKKEDPNPTNTMILIGLCLPYVLWFLNYSARSLFGSSHWPTFKMIFSMLVIEMLHSVGVCLILFRVLPHTDMLRALLVMSSMFLAPSVCKMAYSLSDKTTTQKKKVFNGTMTVFAFVIQISCITICSLFGSIYSRVDRDKLISASQQQSGEKAVFRNPPSSFSNHSWELPLGLVLVSIVNWENYISRDITIGRYKFPFNVWKKNLHLVRQRLYIFVSLWKIGCSVLLAVVLCDNFTFTMTFSNVEPLTDHPDNSTSCQSSMHFQQFGPLYANVLSSMLCSYMGGLACKLCMQRIGFSFPLSLATPVSAVVVLMQCKYNFLKVEKSCYLWVCPETDQSELNYYLVLLGLVWFSNMIIVSHVWFPASSRMAKIERLFITPMRCSMFTDQTLMLRRRYDDRDQALLKFWDEDVSSLAEEDGDFVRPETVIPQIYACATMWHETTSEMTQLFKSIFRIDIDHSARFLAQKYYGIKDPDYYEFEAHIFFDDAMEISDDDKLVPNSFVADLVDCLDNALSSVHGRQMTLGPPTRTPTPYGGQLTWTLPGGTCLVTHLKDKHKIRHKKRWSQVMYMYYLLGYRILAQPETVLNKDMGKSEAVLDHVRLTTSQLRRRRRAAHYSRSVLFNYVSEEVQTQAENTYLLTLDGDVDFKPEAVRLLVDRMKKNKKCGAACGRIHPIGSGPLLWYQMFEYAIGHWLMKATEHVFGCVLCAPGCFSLFRGSALMDDNVARMYCTRATEAGQYVQYDQGEDRWLSTLLLQQGHRIDYCAAADALTHAPETFSEFFNQRRRWGPSTLANIINLLGDWRNSVRMNDNLSTPYMFYQFSLLVSTLLGPATVLLMMAGAYTVVFKTSIVQSYAMSLGPAVGYILICMYLRPQIQLTIGAVMSAIYAIVMTIVLVGTVGTAIEGSVTSPNVIFLIMLILIFLVAALMHPEEFACVIPGALYFICIPAGYLVLNIYFLCNLHVVSWGTREVPKRKTKEDLLKEKEDEEERHKKKMQKKGILGWLGIQSILNEVGEMFRQLKTMMYDASHIDNPRGKSEALLEELIIEIRKDRGDERSTFSDRPRSSSHLSIKSQAVPLTLVTSEVPKLNDEIPQWMANENPDNPAWLTSPITGNGPIIRLDDRELAFWKQIIKKYLKPIVLDKEHQEKITADLLTLRNNVVFGFFMTSSLWIALSMELEALQDELQDFLFFQIPRFGGVGKPLTFQPLGLFFLSFFALILFFQFIGMFAHRWGTMLHMLSITDLVFGQRFTEQDKIRDIILKVVELQKIRDIENEPDPDFEEPLPDYLSESDTESSHYSESISSQGVPPSYHTHDVPIQGQPFQRVSGRRRQIFDSLGHPTGHTLRNAFEKRFRNRLETDRNENCSDGAFLETLDEESRISPIPDYLNY